jgi:hypothetical protein
MSTYAQELYTDGLVTITKDTITLNNYYFFGVSKKIPISNIERIEVKESNIYNGKYRLWGSTGLMVWFPLDWGRSGRDRIFHLYQKGKSFIIGFTVKNGALVESILQQMQLIRQT